MDIHSTTSEMSQYKKRLLVMRSSEYADVILFDEPTKEMSPSAIIQFRKYIKGLCRAGKSVVIVTHDIEWFADFGEHYELCDGKLIKFIDK